MKIPYNEDRLVRLTTDIINAKANMINIKRDIDKLNVELELMDHNIKTIYVAIGDLLS